MKITKTGSFLIIPIMALALAVPAFAQQGRQERQQPSQPFYQGGMQQQYGQPQGMQQRGMRQQYDQPQRMQMQQKGMQQQGLNQVQGQIISMKNVDLAGVDQQATIAKIRTQEGRIARVDLGLKNQLQNLNLQKGDQVRVTGYRGRLNDRTVLMARNISVNGQQANIRHPKAPNLNVYNATVLDTRTAKFRQTNAPDQVFARVRLQDTGQTTTVNLGPKQQLQNVNIREGQNISMLARTAQVGGKQALIAEQVSAGGQSADIDWAQAHRRQTQQQQ